MRLGISVGWPCLSSGLRPAILQDHALRAISSSDVLRGKEPR